MITSVAKVWGCIVPVGTDDGRADGGSNTVERGPPCKSFLDLNEEGGLCLRLLDARGGAQPRVHLRSHRRRPLRAQRREQISQHGSSDQTIACSTVDEFVRLTLDLRGRQQRAWATPLPNTEEERGTMEPVYG